MRQLEKGRDANSISGSEMPSQIEQRRRCCRLFFARAPIRILKNQPFSASC